jgi:hypothetical protein
MTTKTVATKKPAITSSTKPKVVKEETLELPANPFIFEILNLASKQRTNAKKVEVLRKYEHPSLKSLFIWNFDESIISALPPGDVPYAAVDEQSSFSGTLSEKIVDAVSKMEELGSNSLGSQDQGRSSIRKEYSKFYNFVKGGNNQLSSLRRETMFINMLQGFHPLEAEILCLCKDKKLEEKYKITKEIVSEAYPDIKWGGRS